MCHVPGAAMLMLVGVPAPHCPLQGLGWFGTGQPGPVLGQLPGSGGSWGQERGVGSPPAVPPLPVGALGVGFSILFPFPSHCSLSACLSGINYFCRWCCRLVPYFVLLPLDDTQPYILGVAVSPSGRMAPTEAGMQGKKLAINLPQCWSCSCALGRTQEHPWGPGPGPAAGPVSPCPFYPC